MAEVALTDITKRFGDIAAVDDIAVVFQNYVLYPLMDVHNNMAFGLKLRKTPKKEIQQRVNEAAELLGIEPKLKNKRRELSGGQRQRVTVGRAIVRNPAVFPFDEPLSNLDAISRRRKLLEARATFSSHEGHPEAVTPLLRRNPRGRLEGGVA